MNIMYFISLIYLLIFGNTTNKPVYDLRKKPTREDHYRDFNLWIQRNFYFICLATILVCLVVFIISCYLLVGVSAVESGTVYNHMEDLV